MPSVQTASASPDGPKASVRSKEGLVREITRARPKRGGGSGGSGGRGDDLEPEDGDEDFGDAAADGRAARPDDPDPVDFDVDPDDRDPDRRSTEAGNAGVAATRTCPCRIQPTRPSPAGEIVATGDCDGSIEPSCCGVPNRPPARRVEASTEQVPSEAHCSHAIT